MDFSIAKTDGDFVVFTTHVTGPDDSPPLQYISVDRLAELEKIEAAEKVRATAAQPMPESFKTPL